MDPGSFVQLKCLILANCDRIATDLETPKNSPLTSPCKLMRTDDPPKKGKIQAGWLVVVVVVAVERESKLLSGSITKHN